MNQSPALVILYQATGPVPLPFLHCWVQIPRQLPVSEGALSWDGRCQVTPSLGGTNHEESTARWVNACKAGLSINIFCDGVRSNKNREDAKQVGAASAVLYHQGRESRHNEEVHGETVTEADVTLRSLSSGLDALADFLALQPEQQHTPALLLMPTAAALSKVLNPAPHDGQAVSLSHITRLDALMQTHPELKVTLAWSAQEFPFCGFPKGQTTGIRSDAHGGP
jgi:hypothetical protein